MQVCVSEQGNEAVEECRERAFLVFGVGGDDVCGELAEQEERGFFPLPSERREAAEDGVEVEVEQLFEVQSFYGVLGEERDAFEDAEKHVLEVFVLCVEEHAVHDGHQALDRVLLEVFYQLRKGLQGEHFDVGGVVLVFVVGDVLVRVLSPVAQVFLGDHQVVDQDPGQGDQSVGDDLSQLRLVQYRRGQLDHLETQAVDFAVQVLVFQQHEGPGELVVRRVDLVGAGLESFEVYLVGQLVAADLSPA